MKRHLLIPIVFLLLQSCGGGEASSPETAKPEAPVEESAEDPSLPPSQRITLEEKGVGPIQNLTLPDSINQAMVTRGQAIFETNCSACHKIDRRFVGPSPRGIMQRRSPEWIMNMILDPERMVEEDRCAKDLLVEFNGAAMANQNITVNQARDILEYYRTLN